MELDVFAVWDLMSVVKRLQRELTSNRLPWTLLNSARLACFTNEMILGEETELGPDDAAMNHFELYLRAMDVIGADTTPIRSFTAQVAFGRSGKTYWRTSVYHPVFAISPPRP
jgi:hypothetical protein